MKITADTITDEQIRELLRGCADSFNRARQDRVSKYCRWALVNRCWWSRARCAEIVNDAQAGGA